MRSINYLIIVISVASLMMNGCRRDSRSKGLLSYGIALMQDGEYESAKDAFIEVTTVQSNNATAYYNLGVAYWKLGDTTAACEALQKAIDLSGNNSRPVEMLANVMLDCNRSTEAAMILSKLEKQTPYTLTLTARAALKAGSSDMAHDYLNKALQMDQHYAPALYNVAILYRDNDKDTRKALEYYKRFQAEDPNNMRAALAPEEFIAGLITKSRQETSSAASAPKQIKAPAATPPAPPKPVHAKPPPAKPVKQPRPVKVRKPVKQPPKKQKVIISKEEAEKMLARVEVELVNDNPDTALIMLKDIVRKYPDCADAVWALARLYDTNLGNHKKATELYRKFARLFPKDPRAVKVRKYLRVPDSGSASIKPEASDDKTAEAYFRAGLKAYTAHNWDAAIKAYRNGLKVKPRSSRIAYNLGLAYKAKNDLSNATSAFMLALQAQPDKPNALYMLGLTEKERGHTDAALAHLNRLLRLQPDFAEAHYLLGIIYNDAKRPDMTKVHFKSFLGLQPKGRNADQAREWLKKHGDS